MSTSTSAATAPKGAVLNKLLWGVQVLLAAAFIAAGGAKLAGAPQMVEVFDGVGLGQWLRYLTAAIEIVCGVGLLVPRFTAYAAGVLTVTMACATAAHLLRISGSPLPALALLALSAFVAWRRWPGR